MRCRVQRALAVVLLACGPMVGAQTDQPQPGPDVAETVCRSLTSPDSARRGSAIAALRRLRDPALRAVFTQLLASPDRTIRANAILGLGELDPDEGVDLLLIRKLPTARERALVLRQAIELDLVGPEQLRDVADWPDLDPQFELFVISELARAGQPVQIDRFARHMDAQDDVEGVWAALHVLDELERAPDPEPGKPPEPDPRLAEAHQRIDRMLSLPNDALVRVAVPVLSMIRRYDLRGASPFITDLAQRAGRSGPISAEHIQALRALLSVGSLDSDARRVWIAAVQSAGEDPGARLQLALVVLDAALSRIRHADLAPGKGPPDWITATLAPEADELIGAVLDAARSVWGGHDDPEPVLRLIQSGYPPGLSWAVALAQELPGAGSTKIDLGVVEQCTALGADDEGETDQPASDQLSRDSARLAVEHLVHSDPDAIRRLLARASARKDDSALDVLLSGLLGADPEAAAAALGDQAMPTPMSRALADLVIARSDADPGPALLARLESIARGVGRLSEPRRVQAAWLASRGRSSWIVARLRDLDQQ